MGKGDADILDLFVASCLALIVLGISYPLFLYYRKYRTWRYWKDIGWIDYIPVSSVPGAHTCRNWGTRGNWLGRIAKPAALLWLFKSINLNGPI